MSAEDNILDLFLVFLAPREPQFFLTSLNTEQKVSFRLQT